MNKNKLKINDELTILTVVLGAILFLLFIVFGIFLKVAKEVRIALFIIACVIALVTFFLSSFFNWKSAKFVCPFCGATIKPRFWELTFASKKLAKVKLKCRKCNEVAWCDRHSK